jgi:hypothetical protein
LTLPATIKTSAPDVVTTQLSFLPPASGSATDVWGSAESRLATAQPPEPPPTTTKSNVSRRVPTFIVRARWRGHSDRSFFSRWFPLLPIRFQPLELSGKNGPNEQVLRGKGRFDRHKILKRSSAALSKAGLRWYIPLAPKGFARVAFSGSLRTGSIGALGRWPDSFRVRL